MTTDEPRYTVACFNDAGDLVGTLEVPPGTAWIRLDWHGQAQQTITLPTALYIDDESEQ
jgi:hypothetical protein